MDITETMRSFIAAQAEGCKIAAKARMDIEPARWMDPEPDWMEDPANSEEVAKAFSRKDINDEIVQLLSSGDKGGEYALGTVQITALSVAERAFRQRNASHLSCLLHSASRLQGQGIERGLHLRVQLEYLTLLKQRAEAKES